MGTREESSTEWTVRIERYAVASQDWKQRSLHAMKKRVSYALVHRRADPTVFAADIDYLVNLVCTKVADTEAVEFALGMQLIHRPT